MIVIIELLALFYSQGVKFRIRIYYFDLHAIFNK